MSQRATVSGSMRASRTWRGFTWAARTITRPDRAVAEQVASAYPDIRAAVRAQRAFLARAVHYLVTEAGVRQFLDIGTGLPSANNTHQVAQAAAAQSRVVYVDNDPIVLNHARVLLTSTPEGATAYIDAEVCRFFAGLDLVEPGVVQVQRWRVGAENERDLAIYAGVARKP
jgi:hypothetical protein